MLFACRLIILVLTYKLELHTIEFVHTIFCLIPGTTVKKLGQIQEQLNVYSNGERNCLITGPKDLVIKLKNKLLTNGINSEIIKTANIALHHQTLNVAQRKISSHLQKVLYLRDSFRLRLKYHSES